MTCYSLITVQTASGYIRTPRWTRSPRCGSRNETTPAAQRAATLGGQGGRNALEFLPCFWQQAELLVNICTYLRKSQKSAWRNSPAQALQRTAALQLPQIAGVQTALRTILMDRRAPSLRHRLGI